MAKDQKTDVGGEAPKRKTRYAVLERRLANPLGEPSAPIDLKDPSLECRWVNGAIMTDKVWRSKQKGWDCVRPVDVKDIDQIGGFNLSPDGFVTRGDRGQEVLMSMPKDWVRQIAWAKTRQNNKNMGNPDASKAEVVEAAGHRLGDEAADTLNKRLSVVGGVTDTRELVPLEERDA